MSFNSCKKQDVLCEVVGQMKRTIVIKKYWTCGELRHQSHEPGLTELGQCVTSENCVWWKLKM